MKNRVNKKTEGMQIGIWDESLAPAYEKTLDLASECSASKYRDNPG